MDTVTLAPIAKRDRIAVLDVLRGVAVLGILLMNIPIMGMLYDHPLPPVPATPSLDWIVYTLQDTVFSGAMRGLFTLLFGAGMIVMLSRPGPVQEAAATQAYLTRCFALVLLGVANFALFLWPGEILFNYGICGLALLLFRRADTRVLVVAAAAALVFLAVLLGGQGAERANTLRTAQAAVQAQAAGLPLTEAQAKAVTTRAEMLRRAQPTAQDRREAYEARTHYPSLLAWSAKTWLGYNWGPRATFVFETLGFMLIGMALFRAGVLTGRWSSRFYLTLAVGGFAFGLAVRGALAAASWRAGYMPDPGVMAWRGYVYEVGRLPLTLGWVGLVTLVFRHGLIGPLAGVLGAVGRLALTNYVGQSVITSILFYGLGLVGKFGFAQLMGVAVLIWIVQGVFSVLWLRRYEMGPAEWLLRAVTYGAWRPLGRVTASPSPAPAAAE
ncbi:putative membrane protein [Caulobacter sp. AP07]|uniref:DUF418 domain-containing protein n=1 Tax=Caulobacter sp. AP07 TaxID=1144304 RepID=UPI000272255B|nr:DUF418 domain-containing protein [Caulobacter sp. AP07]EJL28940.1 putative membrane protein [Caulobacter sp. AP07]